MSEQIETVTEHPAAKLLGFARRARHLDDADALKFMLVNETFGLAPFSIATLWVEKQGVIAQSGVSHVETHSPFVLWLSSVCESLSSQTETVVVEPGMLSPQDASEWEHALPASALWLPFYASAEVKAGLLLAREPAWTEFDIALLSEWIDTWAFAWRRLHSPSLQGKLVYSLSRAGRHIPDAAGFKRYVQDVLHGLKFMVTQVLLRPDQWPRWILSRLKGGCATLLWPFRHGWSASCKALGNRLRDVWFNKKIRYTVLLVLVVFFPVRLTVLAPAELVPDQPAVIRVPIEGVVDEFFVTPNQMVSEGQPLFKLDLTTLISKLQVAQQEMQIASTEYRQSALQSLTDPKSRTLLNPQEGKAAERQLEAEYLKKLLAKAQITSPRAGVALFDDPSSWIGKPVSAGEKVMVVATQGQVEIEAWIPLNEAIELQPDTPVTLYLNTSPLNPVSGVVRYLGHEALLRPDGSYAYRLRARLTHDAQSVRIGLRGTAKISGQYVPFSYWVFRKPLATLRQFVGM